MLGDSGFGARYDGFGVCRLGVGDSGSDARYEGWGGSVSFRVGFSERETRKQRFI